MNKKIIIAAIALVAVVVLLVGIWALTRSAPEEGGKLISVTIAHKDGTDNTYTWTTNANTLAEAMNERGLLGEDVDGMYLTIDGETTDFEADQSWWCLYKNGVSCTEGANTLIIEAGDEFRWVYTIGF